MTLTLSMAQKGISLLEVLIVITTISFLGILLANIPATISAISRSRHYSIAKEIAARKIDELRKTTYSNLANGTNSFADTDLAKLQSSSASWVVINCPTTICSSSEPAKQVSVTVSWFEGSEAKSVQLTTLVGEGGVGQ